MQGAGCTCCQTSVSPLRLRKKHYTCMYTFMVFTHYHYCFLSTWAGCTFSKPNCSAMWEEPVHIVRCIWVGSVITYAPISGMPYLQYLGLDEDETNPHTWGTNLLLHIRYKYAIPVCDRKIWVSVKFTKNSPKTLNTMKYGIWVDCDNSNYIPTNWWKILIANPHPSFKICPKYAR